MAAARRPRRTEGERRRRREKARNSASCPGTNCPGTNCPGTNCPGTKPGLRSAPDPGPAAGAEARAGRELGAAFCAVLDGGRERLAAAHAKTRTRRVLRL